MIQLNGTVRPGVGWIVLISTELVLVSFGSSRNRVGDF